MSGNVYSSLKPFRFADRLATLEAGGVPAPVHVRIKPTNVCNHACYFCAYRRDDLSLGSSMDQHDRIPRHKMIEIVDDLVGMGVKAVTFSGGGEPLIYPHLVEAITRLANGGVQVAALTNASMLKGKVADAFAQNGAWIRVSIDGWDSTSYAQYRSVRNAEFTKVIANLGAFAARGSQCELGASVIVDRTNAGHLYELAQTLKNAGVRHVKLSGAILSDSGSDANDYHAKLEPTVREQIARMRDLDDDTFAVVDHYHALPDRFDKAFDWCPFARMLTVIGADCRVYTCQDKAYTDAGALGSIADRSFGDFWFSDENRRRLATINPSQDCRHHCVAEAKNRLLTDYLATRLDHAAFV